MPIFEPICRIVKIRLSFALFWNLLFKVHFATPAIIKESATVNVSITVTNSGTFKGATSSALFYRKVNGSILVPWHKMLCSFAKTPVLSPGETHTLELSLTPTKDLAMWDPNTQTRVVERGDYLLEVGEDSISESGNLILNYRGLSPPPAGVRE